MSSSATCGSALHAAYDQLTKYAHRPSPGLVASSPSLLPLPPRFVPLRNRPRSLAQASRDTLPTRPSSPQQTPPLQSPPPPRASRAPFLARSHQQCRPPRASPRADARARPAALFGGPTPSRAATVVHLDYVGAVVVVGCGAGPVERRLRARGGRRGGTSEKHIARLAHPAREQAARHALRVSLWCAHEGEEGTRAGLRETAEDTSRGPVVCVLPRTGSPQRRASRRRPVDPSSCAVSCALAPTRLSPLARVGFSRRSIFDQDSGDARGPVDDIAAPRCKNAIARGVESCAPARADDPRIQVSTARSLSRRSVLTSRAIVDSCGRLIRATLDARRSPGVLGSLRALDGLWQDVCSALCARRGCAGPASPPAPGRD